MALRSFREYADEKMSEWAAHATERKRREEAVATMRQEHVDDKIRERLGPVIAQLESVMTSFSTDHASAFGLAAHGKMIKGATGTSLVIPLPPYLYASTFSPQELALLNTTLAKHDLKLKEKELRYEKGVSGPAHSRFPLLAPMAERDSSSSSEEDSLGEFLYELPKAKDADADDILSTQ